MGYLVRYKSSLPRLFKNKFLPFIPLTFSPSANMRELTSSWTPPTLPCLDTIMEDYFRSSSWIFLRRRSKQLFLLFVHCDVVKVVDDHFARCLVLETSATRPWMGKSKASNTSGCVEGICGVWKFWWEKSSFFKVISLTKHYTNGKMPPLKNNPNNNQKQTKTNGGHRALFYFYFFIFLSNVENSKISNVAFIWEQQKNWFVRLMSLSFVVHSSSYQSLEPV